MGENTFYLVDAGFNNLARPILYGAYHPMAICPADGRAEPSRPRLQRRRRRRPALRIGRHLHAGRRRLRRPPLAARGQRRRLPRHRLRRRLRLRDGQQLQLQAARRRSAHRKRQRPPRPPPPNARRPYAARVDSAGSKLSRRGTAAVRLVEYVRQTPGYRGGTVETSVSAAHT